MRSCTGLLRVTIVPEDSKPIMDSPLAHPKLAMLATVALAAGLGGCAVLPGNGVSPWLSGAPTTPVFTPDVDAFLTSAPPGASTRLDTSPWGDRVVLRVYSPYTAASGRTCRNLEVESDRGPRPALACVATNGHWEPVRVLTHRGLPMPQEAWLGADEHTRSGTRPEVGSQWATEETP